MIQKYKKSVEHLKKILVMAFLYVSTKTFFNLIYSIFILNLKNTRSNNPEKIYDQITISIYYFFATNVFAMVFIIGLVLFKKEKLTWFLYSLIGLALTYIPPIPKLLYSLKSNLIFNEDSILNVLSLIFTFGVVVWLTYIVITIKVDNVPNR